MRLPPPVVRVAASPLDLWLARSLRSHIERRGRHERDRAGSGLGGARRFNWPAPDIEAGRGRSRLQRSGVVRRKWLDSKQFVGTPDTDARLVWPLQSDGHRNSNHRIAQRVRRRVLATLPGLPRGRFRCNSTDPRMESKQMKNLFVRFVREEAGQDLIEYALLASAHQPWFGVAMAHRSASRRSMTLFRSVASTRSRPRRSWLSGAIGSAQLPSRRVTFAEEFASHGARLVAIHRPAMERRGGARSYRS